jgi:DNA-binding NarL/FixJ family response regulator
MIRVLIADDQALVRGGLRMILDVQPDIEVIAEAADGREAVEAVHLHRPDVVLMDVRMPGVDGIQATRELGERGPDGSRVLILTTFDLDEYVYDAMKAGASGFLLKNTPPDQLADAVRAVARGDALLAPGITRRLIEEYVRAPRAGADAPAPLAELTERELGVLELVARGNSNAEIAAALFISEGTVKTHVSRILAKLGLRDRVQAVVVAYESGLVRAGSPAPKPPQAGAEQTGAERPWK